MKKMSICLLVLLCTGLLTAMDKSVTILPIGKRPSEQQQVNYNLLLAAQAGDCKEIVRLVALQADVNARFRVDGLTPLFLAAQNNHCEAMKLLIALHADLYLLYAGKTSLFHAVVEKGLQGPLEVLIKAGIEVKGREGVKALGIAAVRNHVGIADMLIKAGTPVIALDENDVPPLLLAVHNGSAEIVKLLLKAKAHVQVRDEHGFDALQLACLLGYEEIVRMLLEAGASPHTKDRAMASLLHYVAHKGSSSLVPLLVKAGCAIDVADVVAGATPLLIASQMGHYDCVNALLNAGAHVNARSSKGGSALSIAAQEGHEKIVQLLIQKGADVTVIDEYGSTVVAMAASRGHTKVVKLLIAAGAPVEGKNFTGANALWAATVRDDEASMKTILKAGAKPDEIPDGSLRQKASELQEKLKCAKCGIIGKSFCGRCKEVYYCSKKCQAAHWPVHKIACHAQNN